MEAEEMKADMINIPSNNRQTRREMEIHAEQVRLLYADSAVRILVTLVNALLLAFIQRTHVPPTILASWLAYMVVVIIARLTLTHRYNVAQPTMAETKQWGGWFIAGSTAAACGWGLAGIFLTPENSLPHQIFTTFVVGGMLAGATTALSPVYPAFVLFALSASAPMIIVFLKHGDSIHLVGGIMMIIYIAYLLKAGRTVNRFVWNYANLTLEKSEVAEQLADEKRQVEALNESLSHEVAERTQAAAALKYRLEFEKLLTNISTGFINLPADEIDIGINLALQQLGTFSGMDRGYVFLFSNDRSVARKTHEWSGEGTSPTSKEPQEVQTAGFPWIKRLENAETVCISRISDLPHKIVPEHRPFHPEPVKSLVLAPLIIPHALAGFVGFESFREEKSCDPDTEMLFRLIAEMFVNALERKRTQEQLEQAHAAAEAAAKAKARFLANMSHEIRTPLHGVLGMLGLLREGDLNETALDYVDVAHRSAEMLINIIDDVLDFSKIEANKLQLEHKNFQVADIVEESVELLAKQASAKGLELSCFIHSEVPATLLGDASRLRQILVNLVGNAVKFTNSGEVSVRATLDSATDSRAFVRFEVRDTGIGISEEALGHLFDPFTQADTSTTRKYGGTGLGLAISNQLVKLMGGTMEVTSDPDQGSTFRVLVNFEVPAVRAYQKPFANPQGLRVLFLAKNRNTSFAVSHYLESWKIRFQLVSEIREAMNVLHAGIEDKDPFRMILVDTRDNTEQESLFIAAVKRKQEFTPIYATFIVSIRDYIFVKQDTNIDAVLTQPVRRTVLLEALNKAGKGARQVRELPQPSPQAKEGISDKSKRLGHVLLVEDNLVNQRLGKEMLSVVGYDADVADNGLVALEKFMSQRYDLILMDCQMPKMDGYEASRAIREYELREDIPRTPIIALTAHAMQGDREKCIASGMDDYLSKPFTLKSLKEMLSQWIPPGHRD